MHLYSDKYHMYLPQFDLLTSLIGQVFLETECELSFHRSSTSLSLKTQSPTQSQSFRHYRNNQSNFFYSCNFALLLLYERATLALRQPTCHQMLNDRLTSRVVYISTWLLETSCDSSECRIDHLKTHIHTYKTKHQRIDTDLIVDQIGFSAMSRSLKRNASGSTSSCA
jgi:hypothetical protein